MDRPIDDLKKIAYTKLKDILISSLDNNLITEAEMSKSARFISYHLDTVENKFELMIFLQQLFERWQIYKSVYIYFKDLEHQENDAKKVLEVQDKLKQFININN